MMRPVAQARYTTPSPKPAPGPGGVPPGKPKRWLVGFPAASEKSRPMAWATNHCSREEKIGTRPKVTSARPTGPRRDVSAHASSSSAGPSVISTNSSDGGYLLVLRNDSTVKAALFCTDQGNGLP